MWRPTIFLTTPLITICSGHFEISIAQASLAIATLLGLSEAFFDVCGNVKCKCYANGNASDGNVCSKRRVWNMLLCTSLQPTSRTDSCQLHPFCVSQRSILNARSIISVRSVLSPHWATSLADFLAFRLLFCLSIRVHTHPGPLDKNVTQATRVVLR